MSDVSTNTVEAPGAVLTYDVRQPQAPSGHRPLFILGSPMAASGFEQLRGNHEVDLARHRRKRQHGLFARQRCTLRRHDLDVIGRRTRALRYAGIDVRCTGKPQRSAALVSQPARTPPPSPPSAPMSTEIGRGALMPPPPAHAAG